jgi:hypothetical protein
MNYFCDICNKKYASYRSLWNHNKSYHVIDKKVARQDKDPFYYCSKCNHKYVNKYSLQSHIKLNKCITIEKTNNTTITQIPIQTIDKQINVVNNDETKLKLEQTKLEIEKIKLEQIKEEKEILKLKLDAKLNTNINTNTNYNNNIKNINNLLNSNNTNSNNNVTNNFKIYNLGSENVLETLTLAEKKEIIKSRFSCLETATEIISCGKYSQFKNVIFTNLKDEFAYKYDKNLNKFICGNKNEIMSEFIDERLGNIKEIFDELNETNKIDSKTKKLIQDFFNQMDDESKYTDQASGKTWKNFRKYKEHNIKILIYNNSDKNTQDLAIILGDPDVDFDLNEDFDNENIKESLDV